MSFMKSRLRLAGAFAALATLALAVSCKGFFMNPTVSSIVIDPPSPSVSIGFTAQLTAAATDNQGNPLTLSGGTTCTGTTVCWSTDTPDVATVSVGGLLKGVAAGTATITAASGTASATTTATVTLGNVTSIILEVGTEHISSFSIPVSTTTTTDCLSAVATAGGQAIDVTTSVMWKTGTGDSSIIMVQNQVDPMCVTSEATGQTTVFATYMSNGALITSNAVTVNVTP
jgi:hypothetical protein